MPVQEQVAIIYVVNSGQLDTVPVERMAEFQNGFLSYLKTSNPEILDTIRQRGQLNDELTDGLTAAVREYKQTAGFEMTNVE